MSPTDRFSDRLDSLRSTQQELEGELDQMRKEEEYLRLKLRQAAEQVRYYEGLLMLLRRDLSRSRGVSDLMRRLG